MGDDSQFEVTFRPSGRGKAQCPPDPRFPKGIALDSTTPQSQAPACTVPLPYPAPECGQWLVRCRRCDMSVLATAAGRPDDPVSIRLHCQRSGLDTTDLQGRGKSVSTLV